GANAYVCASPERKRAATPSFCASDRATSIIGSEISNPTHSAFGPSRRAAASVVSPVPQPTSSRRPADPAEQSARSTSVKGTNDLSITAFSSIHPSAPTPLQCFACSALVGFCMTGALSFDCVAHDGHCTTSSPLEVKRVMDLDITQVAQRSGVRAATLRFYEEKGLIASVGRRGLRRLFDPGVLD